MCRHVDVCTREVQQILWCTGRLEVEDGNAGRRSLVSRQKTEVETKRGLQCIRPSVNQKTKKKKLELCYEIGREKKYYE